MLLGMNTATLGVDILDGIQWISENGFDFVELSCGDIPNRDDCIHPQQIDDRFVDRLGQACEGFRFTTLHPETPSSFLVSDAAARARTIEEIGVFIDLAAQLGSKLLTFHAGSAPEGASRDEVRQVCTDSLGRLADHARSRGVRLGLEVLGYFGTADRFKLLDELGIPDLGITLDIGHISFPHPLHAGKPSYFPLPSIGAFIERFADRLVHLHVHDYDGQHDHIPIGDGSMDFPDIVGSLRKIGYDGTICLELTPKVSREDIVASGEKWREFAKA